MVDTGEKFRGTEGSLEENLEEGDQTKNEDQGCWD
jgi:hypothetical protein